MVNLQLGHTSTIFGMVPSVIGERVHYFLVAILLDGAEVAVRAIAIATVLRD